MLFNELTAENHKIFILYKKLIAQKVKTFQRLLLRINDFILMCRSANRNIDQTHSRTHFGDDIVSNPTGSVYFR